MLPTSVHILARLQRCHQTRRLLDSKLEQQITRARGLRQDGKLAAATEIERDIATYLQHQKALGRTANQTIAALNRALQKDLATHDRATVCITVTMRGGTSEQKAQLTNQVARTVQKTAKARGVPVLAPQLQNV